MTVNRLRAAGLVLTAVLALLPDPSAHGQGAAATLRGSWAAAVTGGQTFRGTWTAEPVPNADAAQGSWTVVNDANQTVMTGTWAAGRSAGRWSGTWQARIVTRENPQGQVLSGTWRTEAPPPDVKTFVDFLRLSARQQVSGAWASGRFSGTWSLRAR